MALGRRRTAAVSGTIDRPHPDVVPIADAAPRRRTQIEGRVTRMRARPTTGQPSLVVTVTDPSGSVTAVWTGRRAIGGITLGRRLIIEGVATRIGTRLEFTNPGYTLLP